MTEPATVEVGDKLQAVFRLARAGVFLWDLDLREHFPSDTTAAGARKVALVEELGKALLEDPRVTFVEPPKINEKYTTRKEFWPDSTGVASDEALFTGSDIFSVLKLSEPIVFCVNVPKKNQPKRHGIADFPSETYWVSWDGVTVFVTWTQPTQRVPLTGGHVVEEVLREALKRLRCGLYVQACSPGCDNLFTHTVMHVQVDPEVKKLQCAARSELEVDVTVAAGDTDQEALMELWFGLNRSFEWFAAMKNSGRRSIDLEDSARETLSHLLSHYYEHAVTGAEPGWKRARGLWHQRGWRREARHLIANLWLTLNNMESVHRQWADARRSFTGYAGPQGLDALFDVDYTADAEEVASLDISHLEISVQQVAAQLDNRSLAWATGLGAVAGGVAGLLAGLIR